jgi:hypothetical protein
MEGNPTASLHWDRRRLVLPEKERMYTAGMHQTNRECVQRKGMREWVSANRAGENKVVKLVVALYSKLFGDRAVYVMFKFEGHDVL